MKWVLVFVYLYEGTPFALKVDTFDTLHECFVMRDELSVSQEGPVVGTFPRGQQAICMQRIENENYG